MNFGRYFVDRPRFAVVLSIFFLLVGGLAYFGLPVTQYPDIAPPSIQVTAIYPGRHAGGHRRHRGDAHRAGGERRRGHALHDVVSTGDGVMALPIFFRLGTDLDVAQVQVQNRVASPSRGCRKRCAPRRASREELARTDDGGAPAVARRQPGRALHQQLRPAPGVGRAERDRRRGHLLVFGAREYSMRVWLDPDRMAQLGLTAEDVVAALRSQNVQVAAGTLGQPPMPTRQAFQLTVQHPGPVPEWSSSPTWW